MDACRHSGQSPRESSFGVEAVAGRKGGRQGQLIFAGSWDEPLGGDSEKTGSCKLKRRSKENLRDGQLPDMRGGEFHIAIPHLKSSGTEAASGQYQYKHPYRIPLCIVVTVSYST